VRNFLIFSFFLSFCLSSHGQMSKIVEIKTQSDNLVVEGSELTNLLRFVNEDRSLLIPQNERRAIETLNRFKITYDECYDSQKALPAYCVSEVLTKNLVQNISEKFQKAEAGFRTYKKALHAVSTPEALRLLKKQVDVEKAGLERAQAEAKRVIEDESEATHNAILSNPLAILGGILVGLISIYLTGWFAVANAAWGGGWASSQLIYTWTILLMLGIGFVASKGTVHAIAGKDLDRIQNYYRVQEQQIKRNITQLEASIRQNVDFFEMVNKAAMEGDTQSVKKLP
jgi:hypothetical protein